MCLKVKKMANNFGRVVEVMVSNMLFSMDKYAIEGTIPFDNAIHHMFWSDRVHAAPMILTVYG